MTMTIDEFEAMLKVEGFGEITTVERAAGYALGDHQHTFEAWALITSGDITLQVDGVETRYATGQIFRLLAGKPHHEKAGADGVRYRVGRRTPPAG
jgi:quercetin dioxygenase-like cupin family protein